jgi:hypothetical protein
MKLQGVGSPAAGAGWQLGSPGLALQSVRFRLVTSAAVANRQVIMSFDDGGGVPFYAQAFPVQAASTTVVYQLVAGAGKDAAAIGGYVTAPMPSGLVLGGSPQFLRMLCTVALIDVADQIDQIIVSSLSIGGTPTG